MRLKKTVRYAEIVSAIAVVASLVFVGFEVQQSNDIERQLATRSLVRDWSDAAAAYADPDLACLSMRMMNDRANLTLQEATQIEAVYWRIYKVNEELHYQFENGMIDESVWGGFRQNIAIEASYEGYRVWWLGYRRTFSPRFQEFMEEMLASTQIDPEPYFLDMECDTPVGEKYWRAYD